MTKYVTKEQFEGGVSSLRQDIRDLVKIISSQGGEMRQGFMSANARIETLQQNMTLVKAAVLETASTDTHLHNITRELRSHGLPIDDQKVFTK